MEILSIVATSLGVMYLLLSIVWLLVIIGASRETAERMADRLKTSVKFVLMLTFVCILMRNSSGMWLFGATAFIYLLSMDIARIGRSK